jgi:hypothetical protein
MTDPSYEPDYGYKLEFDNVATWRDLPHNQCDEHGLDAEIFTDVIQPKNGFAGTDMDEIRCPEGCTGHFVVYDIDEVGVSWDEPEEEELVQ